MNTYANQIQEIKSILTQSGWTKDYYFKAEGGNICCCIHGAGQRVCNPEVKNIFANPSKDSAASAAAAGWAAAEGATCAIHAAHGGGLEAAETAYMRVTEGEEKSDVTLRDVWVDRPNWVSENDGRHGNLNLHYLFGMFGLTASFNDAEETTLEMVYQKLDVCAAWAAQNEEFLKDN